MHAAVLTLVAIASPALAQTQSSIEPLVPASGAILDVTAEGRTTRVPDVATIRAGVVSQGTTAAVALGSNAQAMAGVLAALKRAGVQPRDIATASVGLQPQYRYVENQAPVITGYQASNSVAIRFRDIARSGAILDALVAQGANQIDGPNLSIDQPDAALDEARTDAVKRARQRAELYAKAAGLSVARIVSIVEGSQDAGGSPPPMAYVRSMGEAKARTSIEAGEKAVTVTLSVRFLLR